MGKKKNHIYFLTWVKPKSSLKDCAKDPEKKESRKVPVGSSLRKVESIDGGDRESLFGEVRSMGCLMCLNRWGQKHPS